MSVGQACLWGLVGVVLVEIHGLWSAAVRGGAPRWPWRDENDKPRIDGYTIAVACRIAMGTGLNAVYAAAHQIDGPLAAVTIGIAAPLIIQHMAVQVPPDPAPQTDPSAPEIAVPASPPPAVFPVRAEPGGGTGGSDGR